MKRKLTKTSYLNKVNKKLEKIQEQLEQLVLLTKDYIDEDTENRYQIDSAYELKSIDTVMQQCSSIIDLLNGHCCIVGRDDYKKSLTRKVRNVLGYTM